MQTRIINAQHPVLRNFVQSFIFFNATTTLFSGYTTFPNTNLCVALYRNNDVTHLKNDFQNDCTVGAGKSMYQSMLYGFHQQSFRVSIHAPLDQICILFHPGGLKAFTDHTFESLIQGKNPFEIIFPKDFPYFPEKLFEEDSTLKRAMLLEQFLLGKLKKFSLDEKINEAFFHINHAGYEQLTVGHISAKMGMNPSTLYRLFVSHIGQSPKNFLQTTRFRKALNQLNTPNIHHLTSIAYQSRYYDQSHFIKDIRSLSGITPGQLKKRISVEQEQLIWIQTTQP